MKPVSQISFQMLRWMGILILPFILMAFYLMLSRGTSRWFTATTDYLTLGLAIAAFCIPVLTSPAKRQIKILILAFGTPLLFVSLVWFSFRLIGLVFEDGL